MTTTSNNYTGMQECESCLRIAATKTVGEGEYCRECDVFPADGVQDMGNWSVYRSDNWAIGVRRVLLTWDSLIVGHQVFPRDEFIITDDWSKFTHSTGWWAKPFGR